MIAQIEEFESKKSIVITPDKMAQYYRLHALEKEHHPLLCKKLSHIYLYMTMLILISHISESIV